MTTIVLTILAIISASLHMWGEYQGPDILIYIFKPLTMIFIITIAVLAKEPPNRRYKFAIIAGLLFSMMGDIFLMLPMDLFIAGLLSFLVAQIIYTYAFRAGRPLRIKILAMLPFVIYGVVIYMILLPGLRGLAIPVAVYVIVILTMAWQAWDQWDDVRARWALLAFIGAVLFVISDSILALNKFGEPFVAARALTLTTYFSAQWLIANSNNTEWGD
ncbi:MAG: lysoplasmalogenase [Chloroflexota bacterium]|nr:MAG: lysoplasmalogenase [Chloroflexota bacterium]